MSKIIGNNKENTTGTFYRTYPTAFPEETHLTTMLKQLDSHAYVIDDLTIEAESLFQKLAERISQDESKIESNYKELAELNKSIEQQHLNSTNDKQIDQIIKGQKESIKELYNQDRNQLSQLSSKFKQQIASFSQAVEIKEKQTRKEREQRDESWSDLIDTFEKEIVELQRQFKVIRTHQIEVFEQSQLDIYHLEQQFEEKVDKETASRKQEHETIIKLIAECIENIRYIY